MKYSKNNKTAWKVLTCCFLGIGIVSSSTIAITSCKPTSPQRTLLFYMCGSDLESSQGLATFNLNQIMATEINLNYLNIIIETGGAKEWCPEGGYFNQQLYTPRISNNNLQRYKVVSTKKHIVNYLGNYTTVYNDLQLLEQLDTNAMNATAFSDFLTYGIKNYKTPNMGVDIWDHGGGLNGICLDENTSTGEYMPFTDTMVALRTSVIQLGYKYEFVGYDACLMGGLEQAYLLQNTTKYILSSEETEPGRGWNYSSFTKILSDNNSKWSADSDKSISKTLVDDYFEQNTTHSKQECTLAVIDELKLSDVMSKFEEWTSIQNGLLDLGSAAYVNNYCESLNNVVQYGITYDDQFQKIEAYPFYDLEDLATKISNNQGDENAILAASALSAAIDDAMVYNRHPLNNEAINNSFGLSIFGNTTDTTVIIDTEKSFEVYNNLEFSTDLYFSSYCKILNAIQTAIS